MHVRKCFEFAINAQWVSATDGGLAGFEWESRRNTRNTLTTARAAYIEVPEELADALREQDEKPDEATVARNFERMTELFGSGASNGLYAMYRGLSGNCHPNIDSIVRQWNMDPSVVGGVSLELGYGERHAAWLFTLAASLVWAGGATDARCESSARRTALAAQSAILGVAPILPLAE